MRFSVLAPLALVACTSTHTVTFTIPPRDTPTMTDVVLQNDMSSSFALDQATATIDGQSAIGLARMAPGAHELVVELDFHFVSMCGYCYVRAYKFHVRSRHAFTVATGSTLEIRAIAYEQGGVTTPIEQRPAVRFVETVKKP